MEKDLHSLIRLGAWEVDEARRVIGQLFAREEVLMAERRTLDQQLVEQKELAARDAMGAGYAFGTYLKRYTAKCDEIAQQLEAVRAEIDRARDELAERYRRQKTYELAQQARDERHRIEEARKEQAVLDEVAQNQHMRKRKS